MRFVSGWRLALRLAWRDALRSKSRSVLVLVMVTFPVVAVVAADVAQATSSVSSVESLDRRIGSAAAQVTSVPGQTRVAQLADPDIGTMSSSDRSAPAPTLAQIEDALGGRRATVELRNRQIGVRTDLGVLRVDATGLDLRSPLTAGLYRLTAGRYPTAADEAVINGAMSDRGYAVGDRLTLTSGRTVTVVGTAESTGTRSEPIVVGTTDLFPPARHAVRTWLVGGGPVGWSQVLAANALGATVLSRAVIEHPPSTDQLSPQLRGIGTDNTQIYTVLALIGVMTLIEVVLLAGPAFAVGARRQARALALISANGGTPPQSRRVVLGTAVVIGTGGAVAGAALGIVLARGLLPLLQSRADTYFGPFQIRWTHLLAIAAFGLVSALLAAIVPAWIASRQDVVAVLAGRRGDRAAGRRSPVIGLVLVGVGVLLAVLGARQNAGELLIAGAALLAVFGMIFLVPIAVVAVARLGGRLPLPLRFAVRDAARHRTRTVPAVAAVAATVAGVVALAIGNTSDQAQARAAYTPVLPDGMGSVSVNQASPDWEAITAAVHRAAPSTRVGLVEGVSSRTAWVVEPLTRHGVAAAWSGTFPTPLLVAAGDRTTLDALLDRYLDEQQVARVDEAVDRGSVVVFTVRPDAATHVRLTVHGKRPHTERFPAVYIAVGSRTAPTQAVVPVSVVHAMGRDVTTAGLLLTGTPLTSAEESTLQEILTGIDPSSYVYVERGYQVPGTQQVVLWILFGLAGVLMLGGTLTATFLALSDARPDLATLSAVGASPRMRRAVAAAYAVSVGVVGAVLGAAVGFIPGIAISYPLTRDFSGQGPSHYLEIPWLEIAGLVVALPLLTALVVGLLARSRLPLVARLD